MCLDASGRFNPLHSTCLEGSEGFICTYFTCSEGSGGVGRLTNLRARVGPLPKHLRPDASEALRLAEARVSRVLEAPGGSSVGRCTVHMCLSADTFQPTNEARSACISHPLASKMSGNFRGDMFGKKHRAKHAKLAVSERHVR